MGLLVLHSQFIDTFSRVSFRLEVDLIAFGLDRVMRMTFMMRLISIKCRDISARNHPSYNTKSLVFLQVKRVLTRDGYCSMSRGMMLIYSPKLLISLGAHSSSRQDLLS